MWKFLSFLGCVATIAMVAFIIWAESGGLGKGQIEGIDQQAGANYLFESLKEDQKGEVVLQPQMGWSSSTSPDQGYEVIVIVSRAHLGEGKLVIRADTVDSVTREPSDFKVTLFHQELTPGETTKLQKGAKLAIDFSRQGPPLQKLVRDIPYVVQFTD